MSGSTLPFIRGRRPVDDDDLAAIYEEIADDDETQEPHAKDDSATEWRDWRAAQSGRLLLSEQALLTYPMPPVLVDDLLMAGSLAALVSVPGLGKSFVALDLALSIASGQPTFLGSALHRHGPAVFVVGEGAGRFKLRLLAWRHSHGIDTPLPFHWVNGPINLLDAGAVETFVAELERVRPALVVIDTLSRCLVGADENSQQTMTQAVATLDHIRLSVENMTVLVLHHLNASGGRERGSSVFRGALDTQLKIKHMSRTLEEKADGDDEDDDANGTPSNPNRLKLSVDKQKDLVERKPIILHKQVVAIPDVYEAGGRPAVSLLWTASTTDLPIAVRVLAYVQAHPGATKTAVSRSVGGRKGLAHTAINDLVAAGRIRVEAQGKQHLVFAA